MQKIKIRKVSTLALGLCLVMAVGCGSDNDDNDTVQQQDVPEERQDDQGQYRAELQPISVNADKLSQDPNEADNGNNNAENNTAENEGDPQNEENTNGNGDNAEDDNQKGPRGTAEITVAGDEIAVRVNMQNSSPHITHIQTLTAGSSCPTEAQDTNQDGFVDVVEGVPAYGQILLPLDGSLRNREEGMRSFPAANRRGGYQYSKRGSLSRVLGELRQPDTNQADAFTTIPQEQNLNLEGKTVVIHGIPRRTSLPQSVQSVLGLPKHSTVPIACGQIQRVSPPAGEEGEESEEAAGEVTEEADDATDDNEE